MVSSFSIRGTFPQTVRNFPGRGSSSRSPIRNRFLRSFLFYVPYVTLAVMTFPSILHTTSSPIAGLAALVLGIAAAWLGANLFQVAVGCCAIVLILEFFLV